MSFFNATQLYAASAGAVIGYYVGGFDGFLRVLLMFVILDYGTALALAVKERRLSSEVGFWGIFKKILIFTVIALANLIDTEIVHTGDMLRTAAVFFYLANEGLSVLEHCTALGLHVPDSIRVTLSKFRNNNDKEKGITIEAVQPVIITGSEQITGSEPVFVPPDGAVMTGSMVDELTDGRCAGGPIEQSACGIQADKPK